MERFIVTFGSGQEHNGKQMQGKCVLIHAKDSQSAKGKMEEEYGRQWCEIYTFEEWASFYKQPEFSLLKPEKIVQEYTV